MKPFRTYSAFTAVLIMTLGVLAAKPILSQKTSTATPSAQFLLSRATQAAQAENKSILLHFGASW